MFTTGRAAIWLFVILVAVLPSAQASAQTDLQHAREVFERGTERYESENYALALRDFQEVYELLEGHPRQALVLYNVGRCFEELGRLRDAQAAYRRYLSEAAPDAENRPLVEERLRELETRVSLDSGEDAAAGAEEPAGPMASTDGGASGLTVAGIVSLAVGGAGLAGFGVFGGLALGEYGTLEDRCGGSCSDADVSTLVTFNTVADISLGVGLAGVAVGMVLVVVGATQGDDEQAGARLSPWVTPHGAGATVGGAF